MKRARTLVPLVLALVLATAGYTVVASDGPADSATTVQAAAPDAAVVTLEPVEAEPTLLEASDISSVAASCLHCPILDDECSSPAWAGFRCSDPSFRCRCLYCNGFLSCIRG